MNCSKCQRTMSGGNQVGYCPSGYLCMDCYISLDSKAEQKMAKPNFWAELILPKEEDNLAILGAALRWRTAFKEVESARTATETATNKMRVAEANQRNAEQRAEEARAELLKVIFPEMK